LRAEAVLERYYYQIYDIYGSSIYKRACSFDA